MTCVRDVCTLKHIPVYITSVHPSIHHFTSIHWWVIKLHVEFYSMFFFKLYLAFCIMWSHYSYTYMQAYKKKDFKSTSTEFRICFSFEVSKAYIILVHFTPLQLQCYQNLVIPNSDLSNYATPITFVSAIISHHYQIRYLSPD